MQEKIADDMVKMAQSLKHTSMMANNIIQQDNKVGKTGFFLIFQCKALLNLVELTLYKLQIIIIILSFSVVREKLV